MTQISDQQWERVARSWDHMPWPARRQALRLQRTELRRLMAQAAGLTGLLSNLRAEVAATRNLRDSLTVEENLLDARRILASLPGDIDGVARLDEAAAEAFGHRAAAETRAA